jgi:hypothetical protein
MKKIIPFISIALFSVPTIAAHSEDDIKKALTTDLRQMLYRSPSKI